MEQRSAGATIAPPDQLRSHAGAGAGDSTLAEVWGDTVDLRHLAWSVVLGVGISLGAFEAGRVALSSIVADAAIARAYAMLIGLGGCLAAGALCAVLFKPKRIVVDQVVDEADRMEVLRQLGEEQGGIGAISDLPPSARAELKELGLLELFAAAEVAHDMKRTGER
jgi:hypothetical protein